MKYSGFIGLGLNRWVKLPEKYKNSFLIVLSVGSAILSGLNINPLSSVLIWVTLSILVNEIILLAGEEFLDLRPEKHGIIILSITVLTIFTAFGFQSLFAQTSLNQTEKLLFVIVLFGYFLLLAPIVSKLLWLNSSLIPWEGPAPKIIDHLLKNKDITMEKGRTEFKEAFVSEGWFGFIKRNLSFTIPGSYIVVISFIVALLLVAITAVKYLPLIFIIIYITSYSLLMNSGDNSEGLLSNLPSPIKDLLELFNTLQYGMSGIWFGIIIMFGVLMATFSFGFPLMLKIFPKTVEMAQMVELEMLDTPRSSVIVISAFAVYLAMFFGAVYSLVYWVQLARRLPYFLHFRQDNISKSSEGNLIKLPPGLALPAPLAWFSLFLRQDFLNWKEGSALFPWIWNSKLMIPILGFMLPIWLILIIWILMRHIKKKPENIKSDSWRLPLVLFIQVSPGFIFLSQNSMKIGLAGIAVYFILIAYYYDKPEKLLENYLPKLDYLGFFLKVSLWGFPLIVAVWFLISKIVAVLVFFVLLTLAFLGTIDQKQEDKQKE